VSAPGREEAAWPGLVDTAVIEQLRELAQASEPSLFVEILQTYLTNVEQKLASLRRAVARGDMSSVRETCHSLQGTSGQLGAYGVAAVAKKLEALGAAGTVAGSLEVLEQLEQVCGRTRVEVEHYLRGATP